MTGKRSDAASRYLYPHSENPNLKIVVGKRVKRVVFEYVRPESIIYELTHENGRNGRAAGIEYTTDAISCPEAGGELVIVKARKLVVVSGGAFGSPSILERSGIGAPSVLEKNNVPVLVDLPGVGENYQGMTLHRRVLSTRHYLFYRSFRHLSAVLRVRRDKNHG